jgi:hypothetical protein
MLCACTDRIDDPASQKPELSTGPKCDVEFYFGETVTYRQLGSQICRCQVDCEIGMPVRIGYIHAKFVSTSAT